MKASTTPRCVIGARISSPMRTWSFTWAYSSGRWDAEPNQLGERVAKGFSDDDRRVWAFDEIPVPVTRDARLWRRTVHEPGERSNRLRFNVERDPPHVSVVLREDRDPLVRVR